MMHRTDSGIAVTPERLGLKREGGVPLPDGLRRRAEAVFAVDLAAVRIHQGLQPLCIDAIAFACGTDIYFAPGCYQPGTRQGQWLISHELAHVVQQCQGRVKGTDGAALSLVDDDALEAEADAIAWAALQTPPLDAPLQRYRPLTRPASCQLLIQPFWERLPDGQTVWRDNHEWRPDWYEYVTWIWPRWCLPRGVYRRMTTSPFGNRYLDTQYDEVYRPGLNAAVGGGLDLDNPAAWPPGADARIQMLFDKFRRNTWFVYTMSSVPFVYTGQPALGNRWGGDCLALSQAFRMIALREFGLTVDLESQPNPFLADSAPTIDNAATGNCADAAGVAGAYWFFQNHFWVSYQNTLGVVQAYDLLFGAAAAPVIPPGRVQAAENNDISTLVNGTRVGPGPQYDVVNMPLGRRTAAYQILPQNNG